jgi:N-acetylglucosaminyldiphosphoundecaprenol N-acetyl-beta-D-mannosaminyltransferase
MIDTRSMGRVTTANVQHIYLAFQSDPFEDAFLSADWWTADGWPLVRVAIEADVHRVTGKALCKALTESGRLRPLRYVLLGATEETCGAFAAKVNRAGHERAWCDHRHFRVDAVEDLAETLRRHRADLILLALNAFKAELLGAQLAHRGVPGIIIGIGGGVGMAAGTVPTAPRRWEQLGLEWAYRLVREPRRLWRRYITEYPQVLLPLLKAMCRSAAERRGVSR